jgi:DNA-binding winged helix-turn-helix (wHTH) protein/tetratricopeptide (TPR) repeat protein
MDIAGQRLWHERRAISLRPKSWDVLRYLVERPGLLVTKADLHREVWQDAAVVEDTLTQSIGELRRILGDDACKPRFIETAHRRGFRFIANVCAQAPATSADLGGSPSTGAQRAHFVGRETELNQLHEHLRRASQGVRQLVFITGEAGIGKTTLVDEFLRSPRVRDGGVSVFHGQCVPLQGPREPYMPLLEALERVLRSPEGAPLVPLLQRVAPCWYLQMPSLLSEGERLPPQGETPSRQRERMLREINTFVEEVSNQRTVVLVLEDLHWTDTATTDVLSSLAQRPDPARLLVIGTYRPAEASVSEHPIREIKQTLLMHRRCRDLALDYLSAADVRDYLRSRFGAEIQDLAPLIHDRSDGNPLFVVALTEELIRRGWLTESNGRWMMGAAGDRALLAVPIDLQETITLQFQGLDASEQAILEAASVVGVTFAPQLVAEVLGRDGEDVENVCRHRLQSHLLLKVGGDPNVNVSRPFEFTHALHRQVIYDQIDEIRCQRLHRRIGEALESAHGEHAAEFAAELSVHFERSGDHERSLSYLGACAAQAQRRFAHREAIAYVEHALGLLERLPDSPQHRKHELQLRLLLGVSLNVTRGYASPELRRNAERTRTLCEAVGDTHQLFEILHVLWYAQFVGAEPDEMERSLDHMTRIAADLGTPELRLRVHQARGRTHFWRGQFTAAVEVLEPLVEDIEGAAIGFPALTYGVDAVVAVRMQAGLGRWFLGFPDQARLHVRTGLAYAEQCGQPFDRASALTQSALLELLCGNAEDGASLAAQDAAVCKDNDVAFFLPLSRFLCGAALVQQGRVRRGLSEMLEGLAEQRAVSGAFFCDIILAFIAAAYGRAGKWDEGLRRADEGIELIQTSLECVYAAELWRIKGELLLKAPLHGPKSRSQRVGRVSKSAVRSPQSSEAEGCLRHALEIAREQRARSLELRAALSLARLQQARGAQDQARAILEPIYAAFTEGVDTKDLVDARALLASSGSH